MSGNQPFSKPGRGKAGKLTPTFPPGTCRVCRNTPTGREKASPQRHLPSIYRVILQPLTMQGSQTLTLTQLLWLAIKASELLDILTNLAWYPLPSWLQEVLHRHTVLVAASIPRACRDPETTMYSFQGNYWNRDRKNSFYLSVTDSPWEDDNLCVFVDRTSRWYDGPQERLMSFCNYYRRSAQEKLEISVIAQAAVRDLKNRTSPGIPIQERSNSDWNRYKEP